MHGLQEDLAMRQTFTFAESSHKPPQALAALKNLVRKYVKRERRKTLPEGVDYWDFACKVGETEETATETHISEVTNHIEAVFDVGTPTVYVEILSKPGVRKSTSSWADDSSKSSRGSSKSSKGSSKSSSDSSKSSKGYPKGSSDSSKSSKGYPKGSSDSSKSSKGYPKGSSDSSKPSKGFAKTSKGFSSPSKASQAFSNPSKASKGFSNPSREPSKPAQDDARPVRDSVKDAPKDPRGDKPSKSWSFGGGN
ncbi:MAG: hypothetical protein ACJATT_003123 [Myxococcota bacterium]|jgi:hypothetical protein